MFISEEGDLHQLVRYTLQAITGDKEIVRAKGEVLEELLRKCNSFECAKLICNKAVYLYDGGGKYPLNSWWQSIISGHIAEQNSIKRLTLDKKTTPEEVEEVKKLAKQYAEEWEKRY